MNGRRTVSLLLLASVLAACGPKRGDGEAAAPPGQSGGAALLFDDVRLFDGAAVVATTDVLVRGERIAAVAERIEAPAGAEVIAGAGHTLLPGLIDSHVHVWQESHLEGAAVFGVTTVLDMMMPAPMAAALREKARSPAAATWADLRSAVNAATAPGGHGTEYGFAIRTLGGPDEAERFVAACRAEGSDYIKIIYDPRNPRFKSISRETMAALVQAAHRRGLLAVAHIETQDDAREAIEAGVDGLVHLFLGQGPDDSFAELAASRRAFVVPTLSVLSSLSGRSPGPALITDPSLSAYYSSSDLDSLGRSFGHRGGAGLGVAVAFETIKRLKASRVPILAGTDAPNPGTAHGASLHGELALLVEAGLTPVEALTAATSAPARAFRLDRGRIAPGMRADLLLVAGDPTRDIRATRQVAGVWKLGVRVDREKYRAAVASERAQAEARAPAAPGGAAGGLVSDFEQATPSARFGQGWSASTDKMMGGRSRADLAIAAPGAHGSKGALLVSGEVVAGKPDMTWAGALFSPGPQPMTPVDLSSSKELVFWAKGDGKPYLVLLFLKSRGFMPVGKPFSAGASWKELRFKLSDFDGVDGRDLMGVFFGADRPGAFSFQIDDVAFGP